MFQQLFAFIQIQSQLQFLLLNQPIFRIMGNLCNNTKYNEQCSLLLVISKFQCLEFVLSDCFIETIFNVHESKQKLGQPSLANPQIQHLFEVFRLMFKQCINQFQKQIKNSQDDRALLNESFEQNNSQNNVFLCLSCYKMYQTISKDFSDQFSNDYKLSGEPLAVCIKALRKINKQTHWWQYTLQKQKKCLINSDAFSLKDQIFGSYRLIYLKPNIQKLIKSLQKINTSTDNKIIIKKILQKNENEYQKLWSKNPPGEMLEIEDYKSQFSYLRPQFCLQRQIPYHEAKQYRDSFAEAAKRCIFQSKNSDRFKYFLNDYTNKITIVPIVYEQVMIQGGKIIEIYKKEKNKEEDLKIIELTEFLTKKLATLNDVPKSIDQGEVNFCKQIQMILQIQK